jgi:hypothetical protein
MAKPTNINAENDEKILRMAPPFSLFFANWLTHIMHAALIEINLCALTQTWQQCRSCDKASRAKDAYDEPFPIDEAIPIHVTSLQQ